MIKICSTFGFFKEKIGKSSVFGYSGQIFVVNWKKLTKFEVSWSKFVKILVLTPIFVESFICTWKLWCLRSKFVKYLVIRLKLNQNFGFYVKINQNFGFKAENSSKFGFLRHNFCVPGRISSANTSKKSLPCLDGWIQLHWFVEFTLKANCYRPFSHRRGC